MNKIIEKLKIRAKKIFGLATWILVVFLLVSTVKNLQKVGGINTAVQKEKSKVIKMKEDNAKLEAQIAQIRSPEFIEQQVRDKLGLAKSGEAIVILPDTETLRKLAPQMTVEENSLPDPIWRKWMKLFI